MSPSLKDVIAKAHGMAPSIGQGQDSILNDYYAPRWRQWLESKDKTFSPAALEHARKVFAGEYQHERSHRISPSALGSDCGREILFSYGGAPKIPGPAVNEDLMEQGSYEHLRWQMAGLTRGWLASAEGWVHSEDLRCGGSMDGIGDDGSLFELKKTADHLYSAIVTGKGTARNYALGMVAKHKIQMTTYKVLDEITGMNRLSDIASLVYQNRATADVYEVRFTHTEERREEVHRMLEELHDWIDIGWLPKMLEGCQKAVAPREVPTTKELTVYRRCPYREHCPSATTVMMK